jgi:hypothetical protein
VSVIPAPEDLVLMVQALALSEQVRQVPVPQVETQVSARPSTRCEIAAFVSPNQLPTIAPVFVRPAME